MPYIDPGGEEFAAQDDRRTEPWRRCVRRVTKPVVKRAGFELELRGGPLAGGMARVRDTEVRITVVREGGRLHLRDDDDSRAEENAGRRIGEYGFSHREEALVWFPAPR